MDTLYNFCIITSPHLEKLPVNPGATVYLITIRAVDFAEDAVDVLEKLADELPDEILNDAKIIHAEKVSKVQAICVCRRFKKHDYSNRFESGIFIIAAINDICTSLTAAKNAKLRTYVFEISSRVLQENQAEGPCYLLWVSADDDSSAVLVEFEEMPFADKMRDAQCVHIFDEIDMGTRVGELHEHAWGNSYLGLWIQAPLEDIKNTQYKNMYIISIPQLGPDAHLIWCDDNSFTLDTLSTETFAHVMNNAKIVMQCRADKQNIKRMRSLIKHEIIYQYKKLQQGPQQEPCRGQECLGMWLYISSEQLCEYISMPQLKYKKLKIQHEHTKKLQHHILVQLIEKLGKSSEYAICIEEIANEMVNNSQANPIKLAREFVAKLME